MTIRGIGIDKFEGTVRIQFDAGDDGGLTMRFVHHAENGIRLEPGEEWMLDSEIEKIWAATDYDGTRKIPVTVIVISL